MSMTLGERVNAVEFDHPFTIVDGNVNDVPNIYAPTVCIFELESGQWSDPEIDGQDWESVSDGMTGQYGYNGPIMHSSEYIGERIAERLAELAEDYRAYAVVVVYAEAKDGGYSEPDGWMIVGLPNS